MPARQTRSTSVTVRLTPALKQALERLAGHEGRALSNYLERLLERAVDEASSKATKGKR